MRTSKTLIWTVAVMAFFAFATAPAADAFIYPIVAVFSLAAILGAGGLVAEQAVDQNGQQKEVESRHVKEKSPPVEMSKMATESAGQGPEAD